MDKEAVSVVATTPVSGAMPSVGPKLVRSRATPENLGCRQTSQYILHSLSTGKH